MGFMAVQSIECPACGARGRRSQAEVEDWHYRVVEVYGAISYPDLLPLSLHARTLTSGEAVAELGQMAATVGGCTSCGATTADLRLGV